MKTREWESVFICAKICKICEWIEFPIELSFDRSNRFPHCICPQCGGKLKQEIGRFRIYETISFARSTREIISFTPKRFIKKRPIKRRHHRNGGKK